MKNQELEILSIGITNCLNLKGANLQIKLCKNLEKINKEIEIIRKTKIFKTYEEKRIKLAENFAEKDDKGNAKMINTPQGKLFDIKNMEEFNVEREKLEVETDYKKLMETKAKIKLWKIKEDDLPKDISGTQLNGIMPIMEFNDYKEK